MKKKNIKKTDGMLLLCGSILTVLILCPLIMIFTRAVIKDSHPDLSNYISTIMDEGNIKTIVNSLKLGAVVVIMSTILAGPLAYLLVRTSLARKKWIDIVVMVPFMTPPFISSMGWILFVQRNGLFQQLFPFTEHLSEKFFSFWGLSFVMALHVYPFMVTILKNALLQIGTNLEEAGAVFGGGFIYRMKTILLPLLTGNYVIGALLVFVKTLSEYGTPYTFGTRIGFTVFTTDIHRHSTTSPIDFGRAASLSSVLISICLIVWILQSYITKKNTYVTLGGKGIKIVRKNFKKGTRIISGVYLAFLLLTSIGIPYFSIICTSLIKIRGYGLAKGNFTLQNYIVLFTLNTKGIDSIKTSLQLAVAASVIAAVLGTLIAVTIHYSRRKKGRKILEAISLLPEMLPSIVLVIGLMFFWNKIYRIIPLYNTLGIMILTYVVLYLPYTVQYVTAQFNQIGTSLIQAGRVFGGNNVHVFRKITFPLIFRGVMAGWMMTFIISLRELVAASMIAPPSTLTISTFIVREFEQGSVSVGMAMAVIYVIMTTGILLIVQTIINKKEEL